MAPALTEVMNEAAINMKGGRSGVWVEVAALHVKRKCQVCACDAGASSNFGTVQEDTGETGNIFIMLLH